jgi:hypothetical protein
VPGGVWRGGGYVVEVHRGWAEVLRGLNGGFLLVNWWGGAVGVLGGYRGGVGCLEGYGGVVGMW